MGQTERRNVFVVGAGASAEFLLPTGRGLLERITSLVKLEYSSSLRITRKTCPDDIERAFAEMFGKSNPGMAYTENDRQRLIGLAAWLCKNCSLAPSIDNLLHTHSSNQELVSIGKVLIAKALIDAEKQSLLYQGESGRWFINNQRTVKNRKGENDELRPTWSWLGELFWLLVELRSFDDFLIALQKITFICFNYDRCIEHFLINAASSYFNLSNEQASKVIDTLQIVRPYGSLGQLRLQGEFLNGLGDLNGSLFEVSQRIRTFTEGVNDENVVTRLETAFSETDIVFFLGFGYLDLNLKILLQKAPFYVDSVLGTCFGLSGNSHEFLIEKLSRFFMDRNSAISNGEGEILSAEAISIQLSNVTCQGLLQKHQFFLRK